MPRATTFKVLRYALIPYEQRELLEEELPEPKGRVVLEALPVGVGPRRFVYWNRAHAFVGFTPVGEEGPAAPRFYLGRIAKRRETGIGLLGDEDLVEITTEDWLPVWMLVDVERQYLAVEMHGRFGRLDHVIEVVQAGLTPPIEARYRHEVVVSPVSDPQAFWTVVERAGALFRVRLRFVSPNFFNAPQGFRRALDNWQDLFNQTEVSVDLMNEEGELRLPHDTLADPVRYIAAGEGDWTLDTMEAGVRKKTSSRDSSETLVIDIPRASASVEELEEVPRRTSGLVDALLNLIRRRNEG